MSIEKLGHPSWCDCGRDTIKRCDIKSLLCSPERDFLIRNNGDQVKVRDLEWEVIGLYFSASCDDHSKLFTPKLVEACDELSQKNSDFEVVFVSADWDAESFCKYFSEMPWFAIPFADSATQRHLESLFDVNEKGRPHLVVLDKNGEVTNSEGVLALRKYGSEAYPFTQERIDLINADLEDAKRNQTLRSVLVSSYRDFLISSNGNKVPVSDLEGKIVGLYFSDFVSSCNRFTSKLVKMYKRLRDRGENFEVVLVPLDVDESSFQLGFATVPWLAIPFKDKSCGRLGCYFGHEDIPMLAVIGFDGKTLVPNAVELVEKHGDEAYPFSLQKMEELAEKEKARMESQNLESLLVSWEGDYVIGNGDVKIPVSSLVGKNILLYFSCDEVGTFGGVLPKLIEVYNEIKAKDANFEVIFLSDDDDEAAFKNHFSSMPWLAVPFGDGRATSLREGFLIRGVPALRPIGPTGRLLNMNFVDVIIYYGAEAYPFTKERLIELKVAADEKAKQWPERLQHPHHKEHVLVRTKPSFYCCSGCREDGFLWSFACESCHFNLHPECALEENPKGKQWPERLQHPLHEEHVLVRTKQGFYCCSRCRETGFLWSFACEYCHFNLHPECALEENPKVIRVPVRRIQRLKCDLD